MFTLTNRGGGSSNVGPLSYNVWHFSLSHAGGWGGGALQVSTPLKGGGACQVVPCPILNDISQMYCILVYS